MQFKPEAASTYYPMTHAAMTHANHLSSASSVVVPQLSSYAVSLGAESNSDMIESSPYMGYGTIGLNEAMYISAPSVHQSQNGLMNSGLPTNSMMAHYSGLGKFSKNLIFDRK